MFSSRTWPGSAGRSLPPARARGIHLLAARAPSPRGAARAPAASRCCAVGALGIERRGEGEEHLAHGEHGREVAPDLAPLAQRDDLEAAGHADRAADRARRHLARRSRATSGSSACSRCTQPRSPPCSAVCAWLNCVADHREGHALAQLADHVSTKRRASASCARVVHRDEDLGDKEFRLAGARALRRRSASLISASEVCACCRAARAAAGSSRSARGSGRTARAARRRRGAAVRAARRRQAVAALDLADRVGDIARRSPRCGGAAPPAGAAARRSAGA